MGTGKAPRVEVELVLRDKSLLTNQILLNLSHVSSPTLSKRNYFPTKHLVHARAQGTNLEEQGLSSHPHKATMSMTGLFERYHNTNK